MKILIAESDADSRQLLESTLARWGYELVVTSNGTEAWEALQKEHAPVLAILDSKKEGVGGIQICREVRKRGDDPYVFVLLLAAKEEKQDILEGIEAGADEYLTKPLDGVELKVRLRAATRSMELREELHRAQETIGYQAYHDPLTGLWNRAAIVDTLRRELARVRREGTPVGVMMAALDGLKNINDAYGQAAGDDVLRAAARKIRSSLRPYDAVGRYGGELFLMIVPGCDERNALIQAERLQTLISGQTIEISQWGKFPHAGEGMVPVTISLGVAVGGGDHQAEALLRAAEVAVNRARVAGGNRAELATTPHPTSGS